MAARALPSIRSGTWRWHGITGRSTVHMRPASSSRSKRTSKHATGLPSCEMTLRVRWLGRVPYREALAVQQALFDHGSEDHLLLLEHPHVFTHGPRADLTTNVLVDPSAVDAHLFSASHGRDVTK